MKKAKRIFCTLLSLCLLLGCVLTVNAANTFATPGNTTTTGLSLNGNYVDATDFTQLPVSDTAYSDSGRGTQCTVDMTSAIFTQGIWLDDESFLAAGSDKSNFHGFYARDVNSDNVTDCIEAASYDYQGMRFTLGMNAEPGVSGEAIVIKMESNFNGGFDTWPHGVNITLKTPTGDVNMLAPSSVESNVNYYFFDSANGTLTTVNYAANGWVSMPYRYPVGYLVLPLTMFSNSTLDTSDITSVYFSLSSYWGINTKIYSVGYATDMYAMLGISRPVSPLADTDHFVAGTDFSGLTPSSVDYIDGNAYGWGCTLNTDSKIFADGYWVDDASFIGVGSDKSNLHGFYATDKDGNGTTDFLEAFPYNNGGMRFTLAMTETVNMVGQAVAIHMQSSFDPNAFSAWLQSLGLTLNTAGGSYSIKGIADVDADVKYYYYDAANNTITAHSYKNEGWLHLPALYAEGYLILPYEMFNGEINASEIESIKFDFSSYWGSNTRIYDVGFVDDLAGLLKTNVGDSNNDGLRDIYDLILMRNKLLQISVDVDKYLFDVNKDNKVNIVDLLEFKNAIL